MILYLDFYMVSKAPQMVLNRTALRRSCYLTSKPAEINAGSAGAGGEGAWEPAFLQCCRWWPLFPSKDIWSPKPQTRDAQDVPLGAGLHPSRLATGPRGLRAQPPTSPEPCLTVDRDPPPPRSLGRLQLLHQSCYPWAAEGEWRLGFLLKTTFIFHFRTNQILCVTSFIHLS